MTPTTPSTSSVTSTAAQTLLQSLNTGSGVDTAALTKSLVEAQFAAQNARLTTESTQVTTQISGIASMKSALTGFNSALAGLVKGGTLANQPVSSNGAVVTASAIAGGAPVASSTSLTVTQLAQAQGARTVTPVANRAATIGSGTFTLTLGTATYAADGTAMTDFTAGSGTAVTIDVANASLDGIAAAINAKKAGVTASVVADADGKAYLSLRGDTGAAHAFTLQATNDPSGNLAQFDVRPGAATQITAAAKNAQLTVNGIAVERSSNIVTDLIDGVKLQLASVSAAPVTISATTPTDALSQSVADLVETYNQVLAIVTAQTDPQSGVLRSDLGAKSLLQSLHAMTLASLLPAGAAGAPRTLAEIGVATNRDGTLRVDTATLTKMLAEHPETVQAMFAPSADKSQGIAAALDKVVAQSVNTTGLGTKHGLDASAERYADEQDDIAVRQTKIATQSEQMTDRLTKQFASMNARVSAYKATQTFIQNQVDAWNKDD